MRKKLSVIFLVLFIVIQLSPLQVNASTVSKELKISSELTQWVLDEHTNTLYAISETGKNLIFINSTTMSIEKNLTLNGRPTDIIKNNGKLYIALDELNQIVTVDMANMDFQTQVGIQYLMELTYIMPAGILNWMIQVDLMEILEAQKT